MIRRPARASVGLIALFVSLAGRSSRAAAQKPAPATPIAGYTFNDSHLHLTNYVQEGTDIHAFLRIMGDRVGPVALFGIPLQQQWSYRIDGDHAPTYYFDTDAHLYYYFAAEAGLVVLIHNDITVPFPGSDKPPAYLAEILALFERHPKTTIIWAHRTRCLSGHGHAWTDATMLSRDAQPRTECRDRAGAGRRGLLRGLLRGRRNGPGG